MNISEVISIVSGPGITRLYDSLRLGEQLKESSVEFTLRLGPLTLPFPKTSVKIEGLHKANPEGTDLFFWGKIIKTDILTLDLGRPYAFGRWNTRGGPGYMVAAEKSFFQNPLGFEPRLSIFDNSSPDRHREAW